MQIIYGANSTYIDITSKFPSLEDFFIPVGDAARERLAGSDPLYGVMKHIIIIQDNGDKLEVPANMCLLSTKGKELKPCRLLQILYGVNDKYIDITNKFDINHSFIIPEGDMSRIKIAGGQDPWYGLLKHIKIIHIDTEIYVPAESVLSATLVHEQRFTFRTFTPVKNIIDIYTDLRLPQELMSYPSIFTQLHRLLTVFITPNDSVLELGAYTGLTSGIISNITDKLVCYECNPEAASILEKTRDLNGFKFPIHVAAISKNPLMIRKYNNPFSVIPPRTPLCPVKDMRIEDGWQQVNTVSWEQPEKNTFTILVADCDEELYYICQDYPTFFSNFQRIIMENDYHSLHKKLFVEQSLKDHGFTRICQIGGGWVPFNNCFYEVWELI